MSTREVPVGYLRELGGGGSVGLGLNLDNLKVRPGEFPTAEERNILVGEVFANRPRLGPVPQPGSVARHNWKVRAARLAPREWALTVSPGTVNDAVPTMAGKSMLDPAPPVLLLESATPNGEGGNFNRVGDQARPAFFRTAAMWRRDLYHAAVIVSGVRPAPDPTLLEVPILPTLPTLVGLLSEVAFRQTLASLQLAERIGLQALQQPYRVTAGRAPRNLDGQERHHLAHLWLTRVPGRPASDQLFVQQAAYHSFQAFLLLEDDALLSLLPVLQATSALGTLVAQDIFAMLLDAGRIRWWSKG